MESKRETITVFGDRSILSDRQNSNFSHFYLQKFGHAPSKIFSMYTDYSPQKTEFYIHQDKETGTGYIILRFRDKNDIQIISTNAPEEPLLLKNEMSSPQFRNLQELHSQQPAKLLMYHLLLEIKRRISKTKFLSKSESLLSNLWAKFYADYELHALKSVNSNDRNKTTPELLVSIYHGKMKHKKISHFYKGVRQNYFPSTRTKYAKSIVLIPVQNSTEKGLFSSKKKKLIKKVTFESITNFADIFENAIISISRLSESWASWNWVTCKSIQIEEAMKFYAFLPPDTAGADLRKLMISSQRHYFKAGATNLSKYT